MLLNPLLIKNRSQEVSPREKYTSDVKWQKFRDFLVDFKEQEMNIEQMLKDIPKVEVEKCKEQAALRVSIGL